MVPLPGNEGDGAHPGNQRSFAEVIDGMLEILESVREDVASLIQMSSYEPEAEEERKDADWNKKVDKKTDSKVAPVVKTDLPRMCEQANEVAPIEIDPLPSVVIEAAEKRQEILVQVGLEYKFELPVAKLIDILHGGRLGLVKMGSIKEHQFLFSITIGLRVEGREGVRTKKIEDHRIQYDGLHHGSSYLEHKRFLAALKIIGKKTAAVNLHDGWIRGAIGVTATMLRHFPIEPGGQPMKFRLLLTDLRTSQVSGLDVLIRTT